VDRTCEEGLSPDDPELGLEEALQEYERRLAQAEQAEDEKEYGCEED